MLVARKQRRALHMMVKRSSPKAKREDDPKHTEKVATRSMQVASSKQDEKGNRKEAGRKGSDPLFSLCGQHRSKAKRKQTQKGFDEVCEAALNFDVPTENTIQYHI